MTTLICWITYDQNKPASIYLASDSRLSWGEDHYWNNGRKIYFSQKYPDILGYCGDVVFCSQVISQVISYIDTCNVFENITEPKEKIEIIQKVILQAFSEYPINYSFGNFEILYVTRIDKNIFKVYSIKWEKPNKWNIIEYEIPDMDYQQRVRANLICAIGSGGVEYKRYYDRNFKESNVGGFSRSYFMCLDSFLDNQIDNLSGGMVQIAGLYKVRLAKPYGLIKNNKKYLYGLKIDNVNILNEIRWINENFENCDSQTMLRQKNAQRQPKINLGKKS